MEKRVGILHGPGLTLEWDRDKAIANEQKHGVTFVEAMPVFVDPLSITIPDPAHSANEERFIDVGESIVGRRVVVAYTERIQSPPASAGGD